MKASMTSAGGKVLSSLSLYRMPATPDRVIIGFVTVFLTSILDLNYLENHKKMIKHVHDVCMIQYS